MADNALPFDVLGAFLLDPADCIVTPLGSGNINDTYLVQVASHSFVLQKINSEVFPEPLRVIENFQKITSHLTHTKKRSGQQLQVAVPVLTHGKSLFHRDRIGSFWRAQTYIPHKSCRVLTSLGQARRVGMVLGTFHRLAADLDLHGFLDPLPGFHNLPRYLEEYDRARQNAKTETIAAASKEFRFCLTTIERYRQQATTSGKGKTGWHSDSSANSW